jgi:hypothetical protein
MVLLLAPLARAEHFRIDLTVKGTAEEATAHSDTDPPPQGTQPRPVCHVKHGEEFTVQFFFSSNFPHDVQKNVTVRFFVAPEKEAGKKSPPDRSKPPVTESNFVMDFKPDTGRVGLRQRLRIDQRLRTQRQRPRALRGGRPRRRLKRSRASQPHS